jgi:hypothetical protein
MYPAFDFDGGLEDLSFAARFTAAGSSSVFAGNPE